MPTRLILLLSLSSLLLFSLIITPSIYRTSDDNDDHEDLSFFDDGDGDEDAAEHSDHDHYDDEDDFSDQEETDDDFSDQEETDDDFEVPTYFDPKDGGNEDEQGFFFGVDEKDVVVLKGGNFSDFIESNKYVMVEFFVPWCGHCQALAPEYAAAATELKAGVSNDKVALAKVNAFEESELSEKYEVQGFPTVLFFIDGEHKPYNGERSKDAIVTWIKKKIGPGVANITTLDDAEWILATEDRVVLGFLNSLVGPESVELAAASKLDDAVNFYQTVNPDVAELFHIDPKAERPAVVLLKEVAEEVTTFDGEFTKAAIVEFVSANKLPLVIPFSIESAPQIFESSINKQLLLFAKSSNSKKFIPTYQEAAKDFKGKLIFVYVAMDDEETGKPVAEYFGVDGDGPKVHAFAANDGAKKYILDREFTLDNIKEFAADFLEGKLKPFYKSDPIPEKNDGDVKIVVGKNFDDIVLDDSKDVLLEIYAPWCGYCQALEPAYNKLAMHLWGIESIVIAKMDGTTNEHPRARAAEFPTLLFFPAGNKSSDPIPVEADRTVKALYMFLKKHASIPFKLEKPTSDAKEATTTDVKDEL